MSLRPGYYVLLTRCELLDVAAQHVEQFLGGFDLRPRGFAIATQHMHLDVIFDDFGHDTVDGAAAGCKEPHHFGKPCIVLNGALKRFDLPGQPPDPIDQLLPVLDWLRHFWFPNTPRGT